MALAHLTIVSINASPSVNNENGYWETNSSILHCCRLRNKITDKSTKSWNSSTLLSELSTFLLTGWEENEVVYCPEAPALPPGSFLQSVPGLSNRLWASTEFDDTKMGFIFGVNTDDTFKIMIDWLMYSQLYCKRAQ